jgi:hypothetical protein
MPIWTRNGAANASGNLGDVVNDDGALSASDVSLVNRG